jgi:hypothetical protein
MDYTTNIYLIWELKINSREKKYFNKTKRSLRQAPHSKVGLPVKKKEASDNKGRENGVYGKRLWRRLARCACVGVPVWENRGIF